MPRIEYPDLADPDGELATVLDSIAANRPFLPNPYRLMMWNPEVAAPWVTLANRLRFEGELDARTRELAILQVSRSTGCDYEWHHHAAAACKAGITADEVTAIGGWRDGHEWAPEDTALLRFVRALALREPPEPGDIHVLRVRLGEPKLMELAVLVAYYVGLATFLIGFDVEVESAP
jgi:4-carboxymuconolactone decarboxylase